MPISWFFTGMVAGFALAAPVGPVGVLCIRKALDSGRLTAFVAGLGAAFADTFFGAIVGFGLTTIDTFLVDHQTFIRICGGSLLVILGWRSIYGKQPDQINCDRGKTELLADFLSSFLVTLTNPATIFAVIGILAAFGTPGQGDTSSAAIMTFGIFCGSASWWMFLASIAGAARNRLTSDWLAKINKWSGVVLIGTGVMILVVA